MMSPLLDYVGLSAVLYVCSVVALLGALLTLCCVNETRGTTLALTDEDLTRPVNDPATAPLVVDTES